VSSWLAFFYTMRKASFLVYTQPLVGHCFGAQEAESFTERKANKFAPRA
jgi:hypothetical protein